MKIMYLPDNMVISELRGDIRQEINKEKGIANDGGDFYTPFWGDAKRYVADEIDLHEQMQYRIHKNPRRENLYPKLATGFLTWWLDKRRWSNQSFEFLEKSIKGSVDFKELDASVRVGNLLSLKISDDSYKLIYPYFAKEPKLEDEAVRLGLWLMNEALPMYSIQDMRVLDVLRARSVSVSDVPLRGDEAEVFSAKFRYLLQRWENLKLEYPHYAA